MRSVTHHVKRQPKICRSDLIFLVVDDVSHPEKAGFRVLPVLEKPLEHGYEARSAQVASLSALQHETRDHRDREIELLAIIHPAPRHIRPPQILQIRNHPPRIIDAIEESRLQAPRPLPGQELVRRAVELQKENFGTTRKTATAVLGKSIGRV